MEQIFRKIYSTNEWGAKSSRSGPGSEIEMTTNIRRELPLLIEKYGIKSVVDIPCGDFNWMKEIVHLLPNYIGGDIRCV